MSRPPNIDGSPEGSNAELQRLDTLLKELDRVLDPLLQSKEVSTNDGLKYLLARRNGVQQLRNRIQRKGSKIIVDKGTYYEVLPDGNRNALSPLFTSPKRTGAPQQKSVPSKSLVYQAETLHKEANTQFPAKLIALEAISGELICRAFEEIVRNPFDTPEHTDVPGAAKKPESQPAEVKPRVARVELTKTQTQEILMETGGFMTRLGVQWKRLDTTGKVAAAVLLGSLAGAGALSSKPLYDKLSTRDVTSELTTKADSPVTPAPVDVKPETPAPAPIEAAPVVAPKPEPVAVDTITPVSSAVVGVAPVAPKPEVVSLAPVTPTPAPVEATSATTNAEVVTAKEVKKFGPEEAPKTYGPMPAPTAAPAEVSTDYGQLETLVEAQQIPVEQTDLYVAALNGKIVKASTEAQTSAQLEGGIHDTAESLAAFRAASLQWGGWEHVWYKMDKANKDDLGGNPIDTPSEFFDYLSSGAFPHGTALEERAQREMALMTNPLVVTQPDSAEAMLARGYAQADGLLAQVVEEKPQAPAQWPVETSGEKLGLYDASQFAPENSGIAQLWMQDSNVDSGESVRGVELPSDPVDVPEPQHVKPLSESQIALVESNRAMRASLIRLKDSLPTVQEEAYKRARGANRFGVGALFTNFGINLDKVISNPENLSVEDQKLALVELRETFVTELTELQEGRDGYAAYLREATRKVFMGLANAWDVLPRDENNSVFEVTEDTRRAALATLPNIFA